MNNELGGKVSTKVSKEKNYCKAEGYHQKCNITHNRKSENFFF